MALALFAQAATGRSWWRARTPVGELLTDADPETARRAAQRLQRFAQALRSAAPVAPMDTDGAMVLALADADAYASLRPRHGGRVLEVDGFVQGGASRTIVALNIAAGRADPLETLDHEYVHIALNGALPAQPLWLAEGLAELLSAWTEDESGVRVGLGRPGHVRLLKERGLLPMERLLAAGYTAPEFLDPASRPVLYAQSWALVRMLLDGGSTSARERLIGFLGALAQGTEAPLAFANAFGYDLAAAEAALRRSLESGGPPPVSVTLPPALPAALFERAPPGTAQAVMGEILLRQERDAEARRRLEDALREDPGLAAARVSPWPNWRCGGGAGTRRARTSTPPVSRPAGRSAGALSHGRPDRARSRRGRGRALAGRGGARGGPAGAGAGPLAPPGGRDAAAGQPAAGATQPAHPHGGGGAGPQPRPHGPRLRAGRPAHGRPGSRGRGGGARARPRRRARRHAAVPRRAPAPASGRGHGGDDGGSRPPGAPGVPRGRRAGLRGRGGRGLDHRRPRPGAARRAAARAGGLRLLRLRAAAPSAVLLQDGSGNLLQRELVCGPQQGTVRVRYRPLTDSPPGPPLDGVLLTLRYLAVR